MKLFRNVMVAASLSALSLGSVALATGAKEPNCEIKGKKSHVKDEAACTKKKGTWLGTAAKAPEAAPAGNTTAPAGATPPAGGPEATK